MNKLSPSQERVIVFDGACNLCNGWVDFIRRRDLNGSFRFTARQSDGAVRLLGRSGLRADDLSSIALVLDGRVHTRSDAVLLILRDLPFPWKTLYTLRFVPRRLRDLVYALVARTRYRLFGGRAACRMADPKDHDRFLV